MWPDVFTDTRCTDSYSTSLISRMKLTCVHKGVLKQMGGRHARPGDKATVTGMLKLIFVV